MQVRAQAVKQVLLGYLRVPESPDAPLDVVLNPGGEERRAERRVWNNGDGRIKLARLALPLTLLSDLIKAMYLTMAFTQR